MLSLSFAISFCLTPVFGWLATQLNILDRPGLRKIHSSATPLLGGAAVFIAFLVAILINGIYSFKLGVILVSSGLLFGVGILDDLNDIPAGFKLSAQIVCAALVIGCGIVLKVVPDSLGMFSKVTNVLLTLFWIIGITNAMNFFDGMDGLAAGLGAIISLFLGLVAFQTQQPFLGWISVAMLGSCLGFLPYNFRIKGKALIFLGDAGSTVIGFVLACVAVYGDWAEASPVVALASPLLIFWVLIFDMVYITVDRIITRKVLSLRQWIEYVGKDHLHHRIAYALGGQKRSVLFIFLLSFCLGASALLIRNADSLDALLLIIQASIFVVLITILERRGRTLAIENGCNDPLV
ncbi:MAG: undecaprenyl/decaprenyl-phosphate alpha-N-acetylglucosaminyl 1-phosphate transferase [Deltaproteobacteria bacterium]|nr:MAG: undecaprenyl/decaprenyl-phosphate alpha-N-acetylglucosaminyl 1-phosphate transferase [Deltaproteobacteria bacterium]